MMYYSEQHARLLVTAATMLIAASTFISCEKNPVEKPDLQVSITEISATENSVEFKVCPQNAEYYTYCLSLQGETVGEGRAEGSEPATYTFSDLIPDTEYTLSATAFNGEMSKEARETFTTGKATPVIKIQNISPESSSVSFEITSQDATKVLWTIYEGTEEPAGAEWKEEEAAPSIKCTSDGLDAQTMYTISAYAVNGDVECGKTTATFTTLEDALKNDYITVRCIPASRNILVEVKCGQMDGKKYYCNVFSPDAQVFDYDSGEYYSVNSKDNFLKYVMSQQYYLSWATLYGDTDKFMWANQDFDYNSLEPETDYLVYAITFNENGDVYTFDADGILETTVRTTDSDRIGEGTGALEFTVDPGSDKADITFTNTGDVLGCTYGYVTRSEAEAAGGIVKYVEDRYASSKLYFYSIDSYFESQRQERNLTPDTDYYYYTLSYGKDAKLGNVVYKEFKTEGASFSSDYTCKIELASMSGTEAKFNLTYTNCYQGRCCNITKEEYDGTYGSDPAKVAQALLMSSSAEQVFEKAYAYSLEKGKEYVFVILPLGGDMANIYGTPASLEYTFTY